MKKPLVEIISRIARGAAPATAIVTSLAAPLAQGASGDLDPEYANHGRLGPMLELDGAAWSVQALEDGRALIGGGDFDRSWSWFYYEVDFETSSFAGSLTDDGSIDAASFALGIHGVETFDIARQADGKIVAAGRRVSSNGGVINLVVFRLNVDGTFDTDFANEGLYEASDDSLGAAQAAYAVALEPDGHIVVAGTRDVLDQNAGESQLLVIRLTPEGDVDGSFGNAGAWIGPAVDFSGRVRLVRTAAGDYRIAASTATGCAIIGVKAGGAADTSFGTAGVAAIKSPSGHRVDCESLASDADGRLLVAGSSAGRGYAARLHADGAPDPAFAVDAAIANSMIQATALALAPDGKLLVAGSGVNGASIMRLQATGELDSLFGDGGRTWIDLLNDFGSAPVVHDMAVGDDGSVIAAGGDEFADKPFVVRLLGDAGGNSRGVLSILDAALQPSESDGQAIVHVRRSGGRNGAVEVAYRTIAGEAREGDDYTAASGILHWADGDASEREIAVPIASDGGSPEGFEAFRVALGDVSGGAGIGTRNATVEIQPDGKPGGQIALDYVQNIAAESGLAEIHVSRNFYFEGQVSVTLSVTGLTATAGADFAADPVTLTWGPDENDSKVVMINIPDDSEEEDRETFQVELTNPTGGAILGVRTSGQVAIVASDAPPPRRNGGGGALGFFALLILGVAEFIRASRRYIARNA